MSTRNDDPEHACRPFDRARDGFVMGEGAAVLVLEERERALARGAKVYAEVIGYGLTNDGYHMTAPLENGSQAGRAIALALADAELVPGEVQYLNAHGSSTLLNDPTETRAIKHVFGGSRHSSGGSACAEACAEAGPGPRTARSSRFFRWVSGRCRRSRPLSHSRSNVA
ncbi:MAG TPA: beta-ketoacyl synthase N-terminal-like domain-containing protein [Gemmatimonadales bacterium]|nr:beta-ketoacyl synthase N-terminal-like domain-containing protein [Gemmatimonadales bacterium]